MKRGYIRYWRKIADCRALQEPGKRYSKQEAWIHLVAFEAQGVDGKGLRRGEFIASHRKLAHRWRWSKSAVERFMSDLQDGKDPMIMRLGHFAGHFAGHFIICKYDIYNPMQDTERDTLRDTVSNKVLNKGKERNKNNSHAAGTAAVDLSPSSEPYRLSELLSTSIARRDPNCRAAKVPDLVHWARDIEKLIRIDGRRVEDIETVIAWCQSECCFWGPNILSGRKLREKFDQMWGQMQRDGSQKKSHRDTVGEFVPHAYYCKCCEDTGRIIAQINRRNGSIEIVESVPWTLLGEELGTYGTKAEEARVFRCACPKGNEYSQLEQWKLE